ncbi:MAG: ABC transporter ATP-binding protein/permease [Lachnospiraceae bacterium]|nr:ABC transporter ATP-binding protein/permease [Lachnospiraceae bacterium]
MPGPGGPGGPGGKFLTEEEQKNRPKVSKELLIRVFSWLKPYWKQMLAALICIVASSSLKILPSVLTGRIIDEGLIGRNLPLLIKLIIASLAVTFAGNMIGVLESYLNTWIAQHITFDMRNKMYRHLQEMSQRFFTSNNQGDIITRMTSDIDGVQSTITNTFSSILSNVITLIVALVAMYQKNWILATIGIIIVPLFAIPTRRAGKTRWDLTRESQACNDEVNGILNETLSVSGQSLVKLFGQEETEYRKYEDANGRMIKLNIKERMAGRWFFVLMNTVSSVGPMLLYLVGGILMIRYDSSLSVGDITVLVTLLGRMYGPVNSLLSIQVDWIRSMALFTRIFDYFDMPAEIQNAPDAITPDSCDGTVEFRNVSFSYNPEKQILKDIDFTLSKGECVAIVGPSGSGKSTLVNLIPRLYDVDGGEVIFSGNDVRKLDLHWLRQNIGIVTQDTYLFNGTIRENLLYANPEASEKDLIEACKQANIYDFIEKQEKGLDTEVGNRGLKLSGGEKQRISIARVLLKDPALIIFDEATSALDSISEQKIQDAINPLVNQRTSILIAHRLSTILEADTILVIKDGVIAERGQHQELVELGGVYKELYDTQFAPAMKLQEKEFEELQREDAQAREEGRQEFLEYVAEERQEDGCCHQEEEEEP